MANAVQRYVNSKLCCFSNAVHSSDNRIKYGLEEVKCQIIKDTIANIYMEILSCNPAFSDNDFYELLLELEFIQPDEPITLPGYFILSADPVFNSIDGTRTFTIPWSGIYYANDMEEVNTIIMGLINNQGRPDFNITTHYNNITGSWNISIIYSSAWGTPDNRWVISPALTSNAFEAITTILSEDAIDSGLCLTETQLCGLKEHLDAYCKTCNRDNNTPKFII